MVARAGFDSLRPLYTLNNSKMEPTASIKISDDITINVWVVRNLDGSAQCADIMVQDGSSYSRFDAVIVPQGQRITRSAGKVVSILLDTLEK